MQHGKTHVGDTPQHIKGAHIHVVDLYGRGIVLQNIQGHNGKLISEKRGESRRHHIENGGHGHQILASLLDQRGPKSCQRLQTGNVVYDIGWGLDSTVVRYAAIHLVSI